MSTLNRPTPTIFPTVRRSSRFITLFSGVLALSSTLGAQTLTPIDGLTGTAATDSTLVQEQLAVSTVINKTVDGVDHLWHFTKEQLVHGGKGTGVDALQGLRDGTTVVVHDAAAESGAAVLEIDQIGDEQVSVTEGTVIGIDRGRQKITIRFDDGQDERLQLVDRSAMAAGTRSAHASSEAASVTVYYADEAGQRVAHVFEKMS